ncbi:MAG: leucyl aminopeptidase, partial [Psychrobacter glaciei]
MAYPKAVLAKPVSASLDCTSHDALIIISNDFSHIPNTPLRDAILNQAQVDSRIGNQVTLLVVAGKRVVLAPTGPLNRDYDDVRRYYDAAKLAINEAKASGSVNPAIYLPALNTDSRYQHALE